MPHAVIFDVDGVLVDSYQPHFESWLALAKRHGIAMTEQQFATTFGRTSRAIIEHFWGSGLTAAQIHALDDEKEALYRDILRRDFPAMDGAAELIDALHAAGLVLAVGSSGPPENVELSLEMLARRDKFAATVTGRDVTRGKPDPQVFLIAAERLGVAPGSCAVIEDAPAGIAAANAAGMTSIALTGTADRETLCDANLVVDALGELSPHGIVDLINGGT
jgi:beta-phosphoglucomutase